MDHTTDTDTPTRADLLTLRQITRIVSRGDDAESRIQDILRHLGDGLGLIRGRVLLPDASATHISIRYAHGLTSAELERGRYRIGEGVSGRVFQTGQSALIANVHDESHYLAQAISRDALPPEQVAFLAVPIMHDYLAIGVLAAQRLRNTDREAVNDLALLEVVAALIGQMLGSEEAIEERAPRRPPMRRSARLFALEEASDAELDNASREMMLDRAERWYYAGHLHLATDLYLKLAAHHLHTEQGLAAKARLIEIARYYESQDASHLELDVLQRLQGAIDGWGAASQPPPAQRPYAPRGRRGPLPDPWECERDSEYGSGSGGIPIRIR